MMTSGHPHCSQNIFQRNSTRFPSVIVTKGIGGLEPPLQGVPGAPSQNPSTSGSCVRHPQVRDGAREQLEAGRATRRAGPEPRAAAAGPPPGNRSALISSHNAGPVADNRVACPSGQVTDNLHLDGGPGTGPVGMCPGPWKAHQRRALFRSRVGGRQAGLRVLLSHQPGGGAT